MVWTDLPCSLPLGNDYNQSKLVWYCSIWRFPLCVALQSQNVPANNPLPVYLEAVFGRRVVLDCFHTSVSLFAKLFLYFSIQEQLNELSSFLASYSPLWFAVYFFYIFMTTTTFDLHKYSVPLLLRCRTKKLAALMSCTWTLPCLRAQ